MSTVCEPTVCLSFGIYSYMEAGTLCCASIVLALKEQSLNVRHRLLGLLSFAVHILQLNTAVTGRSPQAKFDQGQSSLTFKEPSPTEVSLHVSHYCTQNTDRELSLSGCISKRPFDLWFSRQDQLQNLKFGFFIVLWIRPEVALPSIIKFGLPTVCQNK